MGTNVLNFSYRWTNPYDWYSIENLEYNVFINTISTEYYTYYTGDQGYKQLHETIENEFKKSIQLKKIKIL